MPWNSPAAQGHLLPPPRLMAGPPLIPLFSSTNLSMLTCCCPESKPKSIKKQQLKIKLLGCLGSDSKAYYSTNIATWSHPVRRGTEKHFCNCSSALFRYHYPGNGYSYLRVQKHSAIHINPYGHLLGQMIMSYIRLLLV